ncbi:M13 family metallopeptidase [Planctomycetaceae bacterium SH139]
MQVSQIFRDLKVGLSFRTAALGVMASLAAATPALRAEEAEPAGKSKPAGESGPARESGIDKQHFSETLKPGDDFYGYVNQGWLETTEIPGDRADYGTFSILFDRTQEQVRALIEEAAASEAQPGTDTQKVGDFYRSFTNLDVRNEAGIKPIEPLLSSVRQAESKTELATVMADLLKHGVVGPFVMYVSPDARRSDQYAVYLYQSGITLPDRDYYLEDEERYARLRTKLSEYAAEMLAAIGVQDAEQAAERILALETELAEAQWTNVANRDPVATYNKLSSEQMSELFSAFPWPAYTAASGIGEHPEFIVKQPSFIEQLNALFVEVPLETWREYLQFRIIDSYASALTEELEQKHFAFHATAITGIEEQKPLWKRAVEGTEGSLGEVLGKLYVDRHFSPQAKTRMEELVDNLKKAFAIRIETLDWMSEGTQKQALTKLAQFNTKIGYPDEWKDYSKLAVKADDLVGNLMRSAEYENNRQFEKLGGPIDRNEWHMTPQTINAYYNPVMNEIVFPAAILQPPFFNLEADDAANYGAIGAVIGHEISHGFDDKGSKYDGSGNLRDWWTLEDRQEFDVRANQLVEQYSQYSPLEGMTINGELTLGENIGDLGGLAVALQAYRLSLGGQPAAVIDGLTGDQRFFLGWSQIWRRKYRPAELQRRLLTDPHSPSRYRVNGIVSNMDAFYEAFGVKPGDELYLDPDSRVRIW